jgi:hypothetical protein
VNPLFPLATLSDDLVKEVDPWLVDISDAETQWLSSMIVMSHKFQIALA